VRISGAKNSALKLFAAALLAPGRSVLRNVPAIADIGAMTAVLEHLGVQVAASGDRYTLAVPDELGRETPAALVRQLRASIVVLGPLLARGGTVLVATPGGCNLGNRNIDMHLAGLARMGAQITYGPEHVEAQSGRLRGADIDLPFPSVGATENLLMAAVLAKGTTRIVNAAREPEMHAAALDGLQEDAPAVAEDAGDAVLGVVLAGLAEDGFDHLGPRVHRAAGVKESDQHG
jgi:UDP-N-acetylglucosamine 1-carboxyvinyltransferase